MENRTNFKSNLIEICSFTQHVYPIPTVSSMDPTGSDQKLRSDKNNYAFWEADLKLYYDESDKKHKLIFDTKSHNSNFIQEYIILLDDILHWTRILNTSTLRLFLKDRPQPFDILFPENVSPISTEIIKQSDIELYFSQYAKLKHIECLKKIKENISKSSLEMLVFLLTKYCKNVIKVL